MAQIVLFNKPFNVLTQFRPDGARITLTQYIHDKSLRVAGRLDYDSEGLLLLTDDGQVNQQLTHPKTKQYKTYVVQVDGIPTPTALQQLTNGVVLKDGLTLPAYAKLITEPDWLWPRNPPIRYRANLPTSWLEIKICEGKNRQVRRMTAAVGLPTLRLIRTHIGPFSLADLQPGQVKLLNSADYPFELKLSPELTPSQRHKASESRDRSVLKSGGGATSRSKRSASKDLDFRNKRRNTRPIGSRGK